MKLKFFILSFLFSSFTCFGSNVPSGKIVEVRTGTYYGEFVLLTIEPAPLETENCSNVGARGHYAIDTSKPGGQNWLSIIMAAKATQSEVLVWGTGSCISVSNNYRAEELETIAIR